MRTTPVAGPSAWFGPDLAREPHRWLHHFSPADLDEIERALDRARASGKATIDLRPEDFPLPTLDRWFDRIRHDLLHGHGFVVARGLNVVGRPLEDIFRMYWGLATKLGNVRPQNAMGHLIGHVRDEGLDPEKPGVRIYQTNRRQTYHTDSTDIVGLLCLRSARRGGRSAIVSSTTIFNEILRRRPDLAAALFEPYPTDRRGEIPPGMLPYFAIPIYHQHEGYLSAIYSRTYILSAQALPNVPKLTTAQRDAMTMLDELADDPNLHLMMDLEPGDLQFIHNHELLHDRTAFEDWPEPERRRHLLRIWLCPPEARPLPSCYALRYGSTTIGDRGGIVVQEGLRALPLP